MHMNELLGLFIVVGVVLAIAWAMFLFKECRYARMQTRSCLLLCMFEEPPYLGC
jgi:hypothetical protein